MALLTPNATYKVNGVTVKEKIIPDGTRWQDGNKAKKAGFSAGELYKKQQKLSGGTGKAKFVTIHNTSDLANVNDDGEQYTRATYNENMGSARVHFYVDDVCAWQNLRAGTGMCSADPNGSAEVGWHAGDGSLADGGNMTSLSMEIIMGDYSASHDLAAKDNGARLAAWLLYKHGLGIDKLVTHTYWVNHSAGKHNADVDEQCTNLISGQKWCPLYIFGNTTNKSTALANWRAFKALVQKYLDALNGQQTASTKPTTGTTAGNVYRVQVGSYSKQTNALAALNAVKAAGFEAMAVKVGAMYKIQIGAFRNYAGAQSEAKRAKAAGFTTYITTASGTPVTLTASTGGIDEGDTVKVKHGAKSYTGQSLAPYVYTRTHTVAQIAGDRAVITFGGTVVAAVRVSDLIRA